MAESDQPIVPLTVAISTLGRPDALSRCLAALWVGAALPAEVLVVDQSEGQESQQVVERFQGLGMALCYLHDGGRGLGRAQNIAFRHASHPVVAVLDDDCVAAPDWAAQAARAFATDKADLLTGRVLPLGVERAGRFAVSTRTSTVCATFARDVMPWDIGSGNNFVARREWLLRVGGNDERLGPGAPGRGGVDMDLFYRLLRAGARICYEPELVVYHERTTRAGRLARRVPYGYGMGACCTLWQRAGDRQGGRVLRRWLAMRGRRLLRGLWQRDWLLAYEELLVLAGTVRGVGYGVRAG